MVGEFNGSAMKAVQSPATARMGISRQSIEYQMKIIDPAAVAARREDQARVKAEAAAIKASGKNVEFVFVERGGSFSAKRALGKLQAKLNGKAQNMGA
jgi:hypothetical protein